MSRLGKLPIALPAGVQASLQGTILKVKGPKGELSQDTRSLVDIEITENEIRVSIKDKSDNKQRAMWGLFHSLVKNMVHGVTIGFSKKLEVNGVGYRVAVQGKKVVLALGYSHPVEMIIPEGLSGAAEGNSLTISGIDKQAVGEFCAQIRKQRKPEPYKGKGIKYADEVLRRKEGKTAGKGEK